MKTGAILSNGADTIDPAKARSITRNRDQALSGYEHEPVRPGITWGADSEGWRSLFNNDRWSANRSVFAVADGVGQDIRTGAAAAVALDVVSRYWNDLTPSSAALRSSFETAHAALGATGLGETRSPLSSTLTAIGFAGDQAMICHVGDSMMVRVRDQSIEPLTIAHSLSADVAPGVITRAIGQPSGVPAIDTDTIEVSPGDRFILLTDGISRTLPLEVIRSLATAIDDPETLARGLVRAARAGRSTDDRTALVIDTF